MSHQISRRQFLGASALAAGAATTAASLVALARHQERRNVILIISDSMRRDALACYGGQWVDTPNLSAFAKRCVRFDNAFVCSFPTVPARHDILTGTYTFTYKPWSELDPRTFTLQQLLHSAGIHTALISDTPSPFNPKFNYQRDFDYVERIRGQEADDFITTAVPVRFPCDPSKLREPEHYVLQYLRNVSIRRGEEDYFCAQTMIAAARWLEQHHANQPFFLYVDTFDPHEPWDPPGRYVDRYDPGYRGADIIAPRYDRWREFLSEPELRHCRALYAGEATMADHWIGHLLETIDRLGLYDNTLVLFLSDHGVALGEHGYIGKGVIREHVLQNYPLYPELSRIPLLASYPGCASNQSTKALAQPVHLAATIADFFGIPVPGQFAGASLWPVLQNQVDQIDEIVVGSHTLSYAGKMIPRPTNWSTITDGKWLLYYSCAGWGDELGKKPHSADYNKRRVAPMTGELLMPMLYDLEADPGCLRNIYADNKSRAQNLHRYFVHFLRKSPMRRDHLVYFEKLENT
jgi:arylsulfatase A-like enzyme